ncbi:hypothetical protein [Actinokineospora iranica]|uniref:PPE-repeat protein n=1 Tax=Actinokineospora iranica TaxID=1271860 RepID=A0A1G6QEU2_9PSEU|nr:hypothetical protein [Actinokineospora iranica]SDC90207.1 PPE-repeat protein [Actinokineospora iranica]
MPGPVRTAYTPHQGDRATTDVSNPSSRNYDPSHPSYDPTYDSGSPVYIDRTGTSDTRGDVREQAEQRVDQEIENAPWYEVWKQFTRNSEISEQYNQGMNSQANQLAQGLAMRPTAAMQCSNYLSIEHGSLKPMVTESVDPDQIGEIGDLYLNAGNAMAQFQDTVAAAINDSQADWQGSAGDSARRFMADIGNWVGKAGQSAQLAGTQTGIQAEALAEAKNSMPEEVPFDADAANRDLMNTTDPIELMRKNDQYQAQYRESQAAHEEAARVVGSYDSTLSSSSAMPAFDAPPQMGGGGSDEGDRPGGDDRVQRPGDSTVDVNRDGGTGRDGSIDQHPRLPPDRPPVAPPPGGIDTHTDPNGDSGDQGRRPPVTPLPHPNPGGNNGTGPGGFDGSIPNQPGGGGQLPGGGNQQGGHAGFPGGIPPMAGGMGPGGGDTARGGRGGFGGGGGRGGFGPGGGFGAGAGAGGSGGFGGKAGPMGPGVGAGAGALAAEHAATGGRGGGPMGAAGGRGGAGMGAGMGAGGARGQGGEDEEHSRPSYLVEADPDEVFGTDEMTAPPVIGG